MHLGEGPELRRHYLEEKAQHPARNNSLKSFTPQRRALTLPVKIRTYLRQLDHDGAEDDAKAEAFCQRQLEAGGVVEEPLFNDQRVEALRSCQLHLKQ